MKTLKCVSIVLVCSLIDRMKKTLAFSQFQNVIGYVKQKQRYSILFAGIVTLAITDLTHCSEAVMEVLIVLLSGTHVILLLRPEIMPFKFSVPFQAMVATTFLISFLLINTSAFIFYGDILTENNLLKTVFMIPRAFGQMTLSIQ